MGLSFLVSVVCHSPCIPWNGGRLLVKPSIASNLFLIICQLGGGTIYQIVNLLVYQHRQFLGKLT